MYAFHHPTNHTPARNGRTYRLWMQRDPFGQWTLVRMNGGRNREPVLHSQLVGNRADGELLVKQIAKVRRRHDYVEVGSGDLDVEHSIKA